MLLDYLELLLEGILVTGSLADILQFTSVVLLAGLVQADFAQ